MPPASSQKKGRVTPSETTNLVAVKPISPSSPAQTRPVSSSNAGTKETKVKDISSKAVAKEPLDVIDISDEAIEQSLAASADDSSAESVTVIVRVRPLNDREKELKSSVCVTYNGKAELTVDKSDDSNQGQASNMGVNTKKTFTFDRVFGEKSTQAQVYEETGKKVLSKFVTGYNGCIFAYGQTGSGKTYTMEGSPQDLGLMFQLGKSLFEHFKSIKDKVLFEIKASYLEIYQERMVDLLAKAQGISDVEELKIREDKIRGIYVANLADTPLNSYEDIRQIIETATKHRQKGETLMNKVSSRSHAVLTIYVTQRDIKDEEGYTEKIHKLNLIDLAGSERIKDTGAKGETLKEGAKINMSLSALGGVINALVQGQKFIPYRDSKLTRLLQDSLGGNSITLLIAAMSPATVNYEESLSTLQFADRAKKIKNKVRVNRDPKLARIAELMEENARLKARIAELEERLGIEGDAPKKKKCCCVM